MTFCGVFVAFLWAREDGCLFGVFSVCMFGGRGHKVSWHFLGLRVGHIFHLLASNHTPDLARDLQTICRAVRALWSTFRELEALSEVCAQPIGNKRWQSQIARITAERNGFWAQKIAARNHRSLALSIARLDRNIALLYLVSECPTQDIEWG